MSYLLYTLAVIGFVLAILASIGLHELGHMIPAKAFGGKVTQYFIGFGPTVWSKQVGETEYGLKAIPLGGFVKIVGMLPPGAEELGERTEDGALRVRKSNTGLFTQLISDARSAEWELIRPEDEPRLFYKMAWWKKVIVMAGGPTVNIAIAFFVLWGVFGIYGVRENVVDKGHPVVSSLQECLLSWEDQGRDCRPTDRPTPAADAGLKPGDELISFNGTELTSWPVAQELIRDNMDGAATIVIERDGERMTLHTRTVVQERVKDVDDTSADPETAKVGFFGMSPESHVVTTKEGPVYALQEMGSMARNAVHSLLRLPVKVWHVALAIVGVEERSADSPVSIVGGGRIAGEIASHEGLDVGEKVASFAFLVGGFNLFIGIFNFVPLLPLDGGHIATALWEGIRRAFAKVFRRPDPGHADPAKLLPIAYVVASALLVMGVVLIVADLVVPLHLQA
ncbi:membrane-associated protease RseP (regulator of RpoE activity) [Nocardioides luteus]|uniref:Zinc metalloprotease n=1 Tax=Nocardioides luteus TaxID=1844 RepID=A0ABQ5SSV2_9ACTN|nr:site-2 protease family protein [Nocardioides luteus]MDR7309870.1 membrane-associated protease RseP (regulator of RpoE activity) [Nocardioides luteus]GGR59926.1 putative zinc metalloprotease [Nocardioides luteus]GLJ67222.1 putative zinc metalloprotease [Nocardioides luteus]